MPGTKQLQELCTQVEDSLNLKYGTYVLHCTQYYYVVAICSSSYKATKCQGAIYSLLIAENVIGLPTGVLLKHPSHLKQDELQAIYSALPSIKFIGKQSNKSSCMFVYFIIIL